MQMTHPPFFFLSLIGGCLLQTASLLGSPSVKVDDQNRGNFSLRHPRRDPLLMLQQPEEECGLDFVHHNTQVHLAPVLGSAGESDSFFHNVMLPNNEAFILYNFAESLLYPLYAYPEATTTLVREEQQFGHEGELTAARPSHWILEHDRWGTHLTVGNALGTIIARLFTGSIAGLLT